MNVADVETAESARINAMRAADLASLKTLFDDNLSWVHASGSVDTKDSMIAKFGSGDLQVHEWKTIEASVNMVLGVGVVTGILEMDATVAGARGRRRNRFSALWADRGKPKLLYWQSTRIPA